ncbi:c-type cytochrome biogenesis protein CcmI [Sedimentitalea todarodis]|uniref:C-type cytochrome biogenesis protein CcmI n=1 Tax=Sedimentitalea todarodis TaxID=1631240 RepID=A0ABU3VLI5_9RHOB|nr:c-type cytochrome biogenesis protein CcmI [Sedimentitalea todarodis]MDU9007056.1 c-type cytochrome biogenesis protein CcmI [Sedimentitalea todarodis]
MTFWIITSALALVIAATLALVLLRTRASASPAAAFDMQVYRDQLKDVERDLERGVIDAADANRVRTEISRRILSADSQIQLTRSGEVQSGPLSLVMAVLVGVALIGGTMMLYRSLGAPGHGDLGLDRRIELAETMRETRPSQAEAETSLPATPNQQEISAEYQTLMERLRETVKTRPDDLQGQMLLARNEAATGNFKAAVAAQADVLRIKGDAATAADYSDYATMLVLAAGGYVSPEAEQVLNRVLSEDPDNGHARYYTGLMMAQTGRPDLAFRIWNALLQDGPSDAPWIPPVRGQIEDMARRAGVEFMLPALPGPSAADVAAAGEMSETDRTEMIRGMVQGLSDRLASQGGTPPEWARLIGALGVLGETERAQAIYANAQEVFAGDDAALSVIEQAAGQAGLDQ